MNAQDTKYWELFLKQKAGNITTEERKELDAWLAGQPDGEDKIHGFEALFEATNMEETTQDFDPDASWPEMEARIRMATERPGAKIIRIFPWVARVAAAVLLLLTATYIIFQYTSSHQPDNQTLSMARAAQQQQQVLLPDGSKVWLNHDSELLYPNEFDSSERTVYLKGEAYFEVTPNKEKPFTVLSGVSKTTVLGTSFNLRSYAEEQQSSLTVLTGKVAFAINDEREKVILTPGESATLKSIDRVLFKNNQQDDNVLSWKTGHLSFDNSPLSRVVAALSRHYQSQVTLQNEVLDDCRFTGEFQDADLEHALSIITRATGTTFELKDNQCTISGKGCKN